MNRKGMKYNKITLDQRQEICDLKSQGYKPTDILEIFKKKDIILNRKTVQSIKEKEKKSPYKNFKKALITFTIDHIQQLTNLDTLLISQKNSENSDLMWIISQLVDKECEENSRFHHLIPSGRHGTEMRRIKKEIRDQVLEEIQIRNEQNLEQLSSVTQASVHGEKEQFFESMSVEKIEKNTDDEEATYASIVDDFMVMNNPTIQSMRSPAKEWEFQQLQVAFQDYVENQIYASGSLEQFSQDFLCFSRE